jgi:hypothetical protein
MYPEHRSVSTRRLWLRTDAPGRRRCYI